MAKKGKKGGGGGKKGKLGKDKSADKKKEKVIKDRTFGMKNKGGRKAQEAIRQLKNAQMSTKQQKIEEQRRRALKDQKKMVNAQKEELAALFKTAQKRGGIKQDPKSVICEFFKKGACKKGKKCKFSHDWSQVRKTDKLDIYEDRRDKPDDDMKTWDQDKLEEVVNKKMNTCQTEIICKYFLDALEKQLYGYFWVCPNGGDKCMYRHALPAGYVLKTNKEKVQDADNVDEGPSLEERLEDMRKELSKREDLTRVTLETFEKWKAQKKQQKITERAEKAKEATKKGKFDALSGRDLFEYDPTVFADDEEADDEQYVIESDDEEEEEFKEFQSSSQRAKEGKPAEEGVLVPPSAAEVANGKEGEKSTKKSRQKTKNGMTKTGNGKNSTKPENNSTSNGLGDVTVGDESLFLNADFDGLDDLDFSDDDI